MKISSKVSELLENGWVIHDMVDTVIGSSGKDARVPLGLKPGSICREIDGIMLVYNEEDSK